MSKDSTQRPRPDSNRGPFDPKSDAVTDWPLRLHRIDNSEYFTTIKLVKLRHFQHESEKKCENVMFPRGKVGGKRPRDPSAKMATLELTCTGTFVQPPSVLREILFEQYTSGPRSLASLPGFGGGAVSNSKLCERRNSS